MQFKEIEEYLYYYRALVVSNYDGDTVRLQVDLGFEAGLGVFGKGVPFRLFGIDAPEVRGDSREKGKVSKYALESLITGQPLIIKSEKTLAGTDKRGKYGRYLITIYVEGAQGEAVDVNAWLVSEELAEFKTY